MKSWRKNYDLDMRKNQPKRSNGRESFPLLKILPLSLPEAEKDAAEKLEYAEEAIWLTVKAFILETTGKKPFECQHFFLSDLRNWIAEKGHSQSGRLFVNLQQHIDRFERFSREDDNCWIENYNSSQENSDETD